MVSLEISFLCIIHCDTCCPIIKMGTCDNYIMGKYPCTILKTSAPPLFCGVPLYEFVNLGSNENSWLIMAMHVSYLLAFDCILLLFFYCCFQLPLFVCRTII
jgi:hypothetical protein